VDRIDVLDRHLVARFHLVDDLEAAFDSAVVARVVLALKESVALRVRYLIEK
jgi:hypothetical protein